MTLKIYPLNTKCGSCGEVWGEHFISNCPSGGTTFAKAVRRKIHGSVWKDKITGNKFRVLRNRAWKGSVARGKHQHSYYLQKGYTPYAPISYYRLLKHMEEA